MGVEPYWMGWLLVGLTALLGQAPAGSGWAIRLGGSAGEGAYSGEGFYR